MDGPLHLLRHFGPRKDLFGRLSRMAAGTANTSLQKGISKALDTFFPGRKLQSLDSAIPADRIDALQSADLDGSDLARVKAMCENDPSDAVRLFAAQALVLRG